MKVIIAGSRTIHDYKLVCEAVQLSGFEITTVISGTAKGVDRLGERYARDNRLKIEKYPANWDLYRKKAGYLRNEEMARHCDAVIVVWDGYSVGSMSMIEIAKRKKLPLFVHKVKLRVTI